MFSDGYTGFGKVQTPTPRVSIKTNWKLPFKF